MDMKKGYCLQVLIIRWGGCTLAVRKERVQLTEFFRDLSGLKNL
jgi:hypothetical protein